MAWNRPSEDGRANTPGSPRQAGTARPTKAVRGVIAGAVVVLGAAVVAWWLWPTVETRQDAASTKRGLIKEVKPSIPMTNAVVVIEKPKRKIEFKKLPHGKVMKYIDGKEAWLFPRQDEAVYGVVTQSMQNIECSIEARLFKKATDVQLAYIANYVPGDDFGEGLNMRDFAKRFEKSLEMPIELTPEDAPEERQLKEDVIALRKELKARMDAGEDIEKLVKDSIRECQKLGEYKKMVEGELERISREEGMTEKKFQTIIEDANRILNDNGCSPLTMKARQRIRFRMKGMQK